MDGCLWGGTVKERKVTVVFPYCSFKGFLNWKQAVWGHHRCCLLKSVFSASFPMTSCLSWKMASFLNYHIQFTLILLPGLFSWLCRSLFRSGNAANHAAMRSKGKFVAQNIHRKPITEWLLYWCCAHSLLPLHWGVITVTITCKTLCFNCKWSSLDNLATTSQTALIFLASPHFLSDMTLALPYFRFIPAGTSLPFHQRCCWPVTWSFRFYSRSREITHLLSFQLLLLFRGMARMLMRWHAKNTFLHAELIAQKQLLMCFHVSVDAAAELPEVRCSQKKKKKRILWAQYCDLIHLELYVENCAIYYKTFARDMFYFYSFSISHLVTHRTTIFPCCKF